MNIQKEELIEMVMTLKRKIDRGREQNTQSARKYRARNRTRVNAIAKKYYDTHKDNPEWLLAKREKQRLYQQRRRALKALSGSAGALSETKVLNADCVLLKPLECVA